MKLIVGDGAAVTCTATVSETFPPGPEQLIVNELEFDNGPWVLDPLRLRLPDHEPEALHEVVSVLDQLSVTLSPSSTLALEALSERVGAGLVTATFTVAESEPPGPVQLSV